MSGEVQQFGESVPTDEHYEWHEQVGRAVMFAMRCTHADADFGDKAVCVTCFDNAQSIGALVERFAHRAFEQGRQAERRDWELTADLSTSDEDRRPWSNPYCGPHTSPAEPCCDEGMTCLECDPDATFAEYAEPSTSPDRICNERGTPESECPSHCRHDHRTPPGQSARDADHNPREEADKGARAGERGAEG